MKKLEENKTAAPRKSISISEGNWWFHDRDQAQSIRLDPLFVKCDWRMGLLSDSLGVGKRTFARVVERSLGITGKKWLCNARAVTACQMLARSCKINTVARRLGFKDDSDFTREFKKQLGVSPSVYQKTEKIRRMAEFPASDGPR